MLKATTTILVDNEILIENMIEFEKTTIHTFILSLPGRRSRSAELERGRGGRATARGGGAEYTLYRSCRPCGPVNVVEL